MKYEDLPLRGKISINAWALENNECTWGETSRRHKRKLCRHQNDLGWWKSDVIGLNWKYTSYVTKGRKPKTWKDYNGRSD